MDFDDGADSGSDADSKPVGECSIHSGIAMCDKKIQKEEKFFYEPGGPEFSLYVNGNKNCIGCPHLTIPWEIILMTEKYTQEKYGCRGLEGFRARSIELRM